MTDPRGAAETIQVSADTRFFLRTPGDAKVDATPIGSGPGFLGPGLARGFKVHVGVNTTTTPPTALTVDIEMARYDGAIALGGMGVTLTGTFPSTTDDFTVYLGYSSATPPPANPDPFLVPVGPYGAASGPNQPGAVQVGGNLAPVVPQGVCFGAWNDPASPGAWSSRGAYLEPAALPRGTVASPLMGSSFGLLLSGGPSLVIVDLDLTGGSTLVFQVDRTGGVVTVNPVDLTTAGCQASLTGSLGTGATVKVYGIPQVDGYIQASVVFYYTGTLPL